MQHAYPTSVRLEACYIDSTGLKLLFAYQIHARERGQHVIATEVTPHIRKVFEIVRFTEMIPIAASIRDAVELLRAKQP